MNKSIIYLMWFVALPFLSLQAQSPGGAATPAEVFRYNSFFNWL
jgi:hypothetical protein